MDIFLNFLTGGWVKQLILASVVTVLLAICSYIIGLIVSIFFTIAKIYKIPGINVVCIIYTNIFRCLPELLIIFFFFYTFTHFSRTINNNLSIHINNVMISVISAVIALGLITGSYLTEIFRGGMSAINYGQTEAAEALGMTKSKIVWRIILPQLISYTWKPVTNVWLLSLKDTALVSVIGISELMYKTNLCVTTTGKPFIFYSFAAILYLIMLIISRIVLRALSYRYNYLAKMNI